MHSSHYGQQVTAPRLEHTRKVVALGQQQVSGHCCIKSKGVRSMPRSVNERPSVPWRTVTN
jgi:hypothetical protein